MENDGASYGRTSESHSQGAHIPPPEMQSRHGRRRPRAQRPARCRERHSHPRTVLVDEGAAPSSGSTRYGSVRACRPVDVEGPEGETPSAFGAGRPISASRSSDRGFWARHHNDTAHGMFVFGTTLLSWHPWQRSPSSSPPPPRPDEKVLIGHAHDTHTLSTSDSSARPRQTCARLSSPRSVC